MALSSQQVAHFQREGYLKVPTFFSAREVLAIQAELRRLVRVGKLRNVATAGDGKTPSTEVANLQLCPMYSHSTLFRSLPFQDKVVSAISQLIGDPHILHLDQVFLKPGRHGAGTNWHQDNAYFKISDPMKGTAMWIAAHDATVANGTLQVIPRAFAQPLEHTRDPYSDHHVRCYPDESQAVPMEIPAGGVIFFCYGTPHCTTGNKTDKERAGVAFHFLRADYAQTELIDPKRDYRPYLTGPQATGGVREYGVNVAGTWLNEVEQAIAQDVK